MFVLSRLNKRMNKYCIFCLQNILPYVTSIKYNIFFLKTILHVVFVVEIVSGLFLVIAERPPDPLNIPVCCGYLFGGRGFAGPQGVTTDVPQSLATRRFGWTDHFWQNGPSTWTELWWDLQKLCLPRDQRSHCKANTGRRCCCKASSKFKVIKLPRRDKGEI